MARDLNKFISDHRKSHNRYISAVDTLIEKYEDGSDDELDSVINLSSCKVVRDKKGLFSNPRIFGSAKFTKRSSHPKRDKYKHKDKKEDDPSLIYVCDAGSDFEENMDDRLLHDVSTVHHAIQASFLEDGEEEPSDAETLSSSSSESYETVISDCEVTADSLSQEDSEHGEYGDEHRENTYDEIDGDLDSFTPAKLTIPNTKSSSRNNYLRKSDETFTIEECDQYDDNFVSGNLRNQLMSIPSHNKKLTQENCVTGLQSDSKTRVLHSECNNNYQYDNLNMDTEDQSCDKKIRTDEKSLKVPLQKTGGQNVKRIKTVFTPFNKLPDQHRYENVPKYSDLKSENNNERNKSGKSLQSMGKDPAQCEESAGKNDNFRDVHRNNLMHSEQVSSKFNNDLSPSHRKKFDGKKDGKSRDSGITCGLLSPLQSRKVNTVKSSTKTNVRKLYVNDLEHEELSKKDSGVSTCHDESFALSSPTYEEIPEALTTKNLAQFNKSLVEESTFINVSMNTSRLKTDEKIDDVEKWLNNVSTEMDKEHDAYGEGGDNQMFDELRNNRLSPKLERSVSEVRTASKKRLETVQNSEQFVDNNTNIVGSYGNSPRLPKSPKSMQYLRNVEDIARSAQRRSLENTSESHRTKLKGQRCQTPMLIFQNLKASHIAEMMRVNCDNDEYFAHRKSSDFNGKRLINYDSDLICSDDDSSALPTPPKSRRISRSNSCTKSTQVDARFLSAVSINRNNSVATYHSPRSSNRNIEQTGGSMYDYIDDTRDTGSFTNVENNSNQLSCLQKTQNVCSRSARKSINQSRSMESHDMSNSQLHHGSFQSPEKNAYSYFENSSGVSHLNNPDDDLVFLNTYPAQSSVRKLNVSAKSKSVNTGRSYSHKNVSRNNVLVRRAGCQPMSHNTDYSLNTSSGRSVNDARAAEYTHSLQEYPYTMCNFVDGQTVTERRQQLRQSSTPKRRPDIKIVSPRSSTDNMQKNFSPVFNRQQNVQIKPNSGLMSHEIKTNRRHERSFSNDRKIGLTPMNDFNDNNHDTVGEGVDLYDEEHVRREYLDAMMSEKIDNKRRHLIGGVRQNNEIIRGGRDLDSDFEEHDKSEMHPKNLQLSPRRQRSESYQMAFDQKQHVDSELFDSYRRNNIQHRSDEHRNMDEDIQGDSHERKNDVHRSASIERRNCKTYVKDMSPVKDVRGQPVTTERNNFDNFSSPNVRRPAQKQDAFEFKSPSTTSRQYNNCSNFQSPTVNRMKHNEEFSPSTSLAKMKLNTPKSRTKHQREVSPRYSLNKDFDLNSRNKRNVIIDSNGANSGQGFISLDQMQNNPLLFKVHMIGAEQTDYSEDEARGDHVDFSNNYICDQLYTQQNRDSEKDICKSNDNVYHKYCDEIRDEGRESGGYRNDDLQTDDMLKQNLEHSRNSPQKHTPKMKKSLFSPGVENRNSNLIPHQRVPAQRNSQDFKDFKVPVSPSVVMKSKSNMHNKENVMTRTGRVTPSLRDKRSVSNEVASRLGNKLTSKSSLNYMQSTPVKPGFEFTLNTTMSTILGSEDTEADNDEDEEIVLM